MPGIGRREEIRIPRLPEPVSRNDATATFADVCKVTVFLKNIAVEIEAIAVLPG